MYYSLYGICLKWCIEQFDVVLDKAAMDAIIVDEEDIWCPNEATVSVVDRMCLSVTKCLKPGNDSSMHER